MNPFNIHIWYWGLRTICYKYSHASRTVFVRSTIEWNIYESNLTSLIETKWLLKTKREVKEKQHTFIQMKQNYKRTQEDEAELTDEHIKWKKTAFASYICMVRLWDHLRTEWFCCCSKWFCYLMTMECGKWCLDAILGRLYAFVIIYTL